MTFLADRVTNVPVPFRQLRMKDAEGVLQEGVVGANDLKIVQRAAGANMSVDFSVGAGWVNIDSSTRSGLVHFYNDAVANIAVTASNATNPRIDQAIVRYNDSSIPAGTGGNTPTPEILAGTATSGATLDNRTGAAALPNDCLRLADILVPATSTSVVTANIRDRRPWARGAYNRLLGSASGASYTITTTGTLTAIDATNLQARVECSGVPLLLQFSGNGSVTGGTGIFEFTEDGATAAISGGQQLYSVVGSTAFTLYLPHVPAAGSHVYGVSWRNGTNAITLLNQATGAGSSRPYFTIMEVIRPNVNNS